MTTDDQSQNERIFLLRRLTSQKDAILKASQEIEDLRFQYVKAGKTDPNGELEKEVWKRLQTIISALSELNSYSSQPSNGFVVDFILSLTLHQQMGILNNDFIRFDILLANGIQIRWDIKKGPIVSFKDLSVFKNMFGTPN